MIPAFQVIADSVDVTNKIAGNLKALRLTDKDGLESDTVEIVITDPEGKTRLPRRGARLSVSLGWQGARLTPKGVYTVDEVGEDGPPDALTILARSADFRATLKDQKDQSYHATVLGDVLSALATRNGLTPAIHADLAGRVIAHLDQTNESDINLVTRLGEDYGALTAIKAGRLVFVPKALGLAASGLLLPSFAIARAEGDRHSFRAADREGTQTGVKAKWHNLASGMTETALAGEEGSVKTLKKIYPNRIEAQAAAEAAMKRVKGKRHDFNVTLAKARPEIVAGARLALSGYRSEITDMMWVASTVTHELGDGGFTTSIEASEYLGDETED